MPISETTFLGDSYTSLAEKFVSVGSLERETVTPVLIIAGSRVMARSYRLWRGVGDCVQVHLIFISASVLIPFNAIIRDSVHSLRRVVAKQLLTLHVLYIYG